MMVAAAELPSPSEWGWMKSDTDWDVCCQTTLPEATKAAGNFSDAAARRDAEDNASAGRLHFRARHYATAADSVLGTRTCSINAFPQWRFRLMLMR